MTPQQAQRKANALWGKGKEYYSAGGHITKRKPYEKMEKDITAEWRFDVGHITNLAGICMFHVKGTGNSWEEAFADAERKRERDRQEMAALRAKHQAPAS